MDDEEYEDSQQTPIPSIKIELNDNESIYEYAVITPKNIGVIVDSLPDTKQIGKIIIEYLELNDNKVENDNESDNSDDYDEDEQLYSAVTSKSSLAKYPNTEIPILANKKLKVIGIIIPHLSNIIINNILARTLVENLKVSKSWITLSPCSLNNNQSINRIQFEGNDSNLINDNISLIPTLKPPHFITGFTAALISELNLLSKGRLLSLVLNSEGQPGFEKIDNDSLVDTTFILSEVILSSGLRDEYLKKVSLSVRKFNSYSNSGMYI